MASLHLAQEIFKLIYPVGSIYISTNSANPSTYFGGTWEAIQGRFLLGADSSHKAGSTGGEATHILSVDEMPSHNHLVPVVSKQVGRSGGSDWVTQYSDNQKTISVTNTGNTKAHNNMPPYLSVYIWKRTA